MDKLFDDNYRYRRKKIRVLILGGGFGGVYAAMASDKTLATKLSVDVTLVAQQIFFLFTPMLHEVAERQGKPKELL